MAKVRRVTRLKYSERAKLQWQGVVLAVQPQISLTRSFDQRITPYLGYALNVDGGVGQGAHAKHRFCAGTALSGDALPVLDRWLEPSTSTKSASCKSDRLTPQTKCRHRWPSNANANLRRQNEKRDRPLQAKFCAIRRRNFAEPTSPSTGRISEAPLGAWGVGVSLTGHRNEP